MYLNQHTDQINAMLCQEKTLPDNVNKKNIQLRSEIARRLWQGETEEERERITNLIKEDHKAAWDEYDRLADLPKGNPAKQEK